MKASGWVLGAVLAAGVGFTIKGGCLSSQREPDEELAGHFRSLCNIARGNIKTPEKGVRKLGAYLDKHAGDMLGNLGDTFAAIERIPNDEKHDRRAHVARDRITKPVEACAMTWMEFGQAVEDDPKASALVERFNERFGRTLEIIFSSKQIDFKHLPEQLEATIR